MIRPLRRAAELMLWGVVLVVGVRGLWIAVAGPNPAGQTWDDRIAAQLDFLTFSRVGEGEPLSDRADAMPRLFPEGRLFTLALTGLAWHHLGERAAVNPPEARDEVRSILALATSATTREPFGPAGGLPHGMFYEAWTAQLRLAARSEADAPDSALVASCRRLGAALDGPDLFPDSYPGLAWPADAVVGASALAQCGDLDPAHAQTARRWLSRVRQRLDPETGLIPHDAVRPTPAAPRRRS